MRPAGSISMLILMLLCISCADLLVFRESPRINKGVLDLTGYDFEANPAIPLNGEVEFYWQQLLTPVDFATGLDSLPRRYIEIPGIWNGTVVNGLALKGDGYATYRVVIKVGADGIYGLKFKEVDCAYKVWANNVVDSVGRVGRTRETTAPNWNRRELYFNSIKQRVEVVVQVSNFHHRKGGLEDPIVFGTANQIMRIKQGNVNLNVFLLAVIVLVGITHLFIYVLRQKERTALLFGILCLVMAIRLICTSEKLIYEFFPFVPWGVATRLEYLSYTLVVPLMVAFLYSYYPSEFSPRILKWIVAIAALFSLSYLVTPVRVFSYTPIAYQVVILIIGFYVLVRLANALRKRQDNALIFLGGFVIFFLVVINDILFYNKVLNTSLLMPYGLAFMVVSQSFALTKRQVKAFSDNEAMSEDLNKYNYELEKIVHERTEKVLHQKEELEAQADKLKEINERLVELHRFKDNMTGMLVHDMKNHLNNIILLTGKRTGELNGLLDPNETIGYSAKQLYTLVMNILDIQRFEEARMELSIQNVNLSPIVDNVLKDLALMAKLKNITVTNSCNRESLVKTDPVIAHRVFINLISNAMKYSPPNTKVVITSEEQGEFVKFSVIDQGYGIPDSFIGKLFDKFAVYKHPVDDSQKSTGLGLPFCKLAVESHGGAIGVMQRADRGAIFWFTLPKGEPGHSGGSAYSSHQESSAEILSPTDIECLYPFAVQLTRIKYYEVTRANALLAELLESLGKDLNEPIRNWVEQVKRAIVLSNREAYEKLVRAVIDRYNPS